MIGIHCLFRLLDLAQIFFRASGEFGRLWKKRERLREAVGAVHHMALNGLQFTPQLLFEERMNHNGGGSGILHAFDIVDFIRKRRGGRHQGGAQV